MSVPDVVDNFEPDTVFPPGATSIHIGSVRRSPCLRYAKVLITQNIAAWSLKYLPLTMVELRPRSRFGCICWEVSVSDNCWCTMTSRETTKVITKHAARYCQCFSGRVNRVPCISDRRLVGIVGPRLEHAGAKLSLSQASKPSFCELEMSTAANLTGLAEQADNAVLFAHLLPSLLSMRMQISLRLEFIVARLPILP